MDSRPTALVTGCSQGGIGAALARKLLNDGWRVFATARDTTRIDQDLIRAGADVLAMDVSKDESIQSAVKELSGKTGGKLNLLVNNAGAGAEWVSLLDTDLSLARRMFDVNVWGLLAVTSAVAPLLVKSATSTDGSDTRATVANVSSVWAVQGGAFRGVYSISKHAVKAICDSMRKETKCVGISVVELITGGIATHIVDNAGPMRKKDNSQSVYSKDLNDHITQVMNQTRPKQIAGSIPPAEYAAYVVPRITRQHPPAQVYCGVRFPFFVSALFHPPDGGIFRAVPCFAIPLAHTVPAVALVRLDFDAAARFIAAAHLMEVKSSIVEKTLHKLRGYGPPL